MEHIKVTTEKIIKDWQGIKHPQPERLLKEALKKNFTKQEQRHIRSYAFKPSGVILNIDSSAWLYQLNLKKEKLSRDLNQCLKPRDTGIEIYLQLDRNEEKT